MDITGTLKTPRLPAAPSSPAVGQMYFNTADNTLYWWNGTIWVSAKGGGSATVVTTDWNNITATGWYMATMFPMPAHSPAGLGTTYGADVFVEVSAGPPYTKQIMYSVGEPQHVWQRSYGGDFWGAWERVDGGASVVGADTYFAVGTGAATASGGGALFAPLATSGAANSDPATFQLNANGTLTVLKAGAFVITATVGISGGPLAAGNRLESSLVYWLAGHTPSGANWDGTYCTDESLAPYPYSGLSAAVYLAAGTILGCGTYADVACSRISVRFQIARVVGPQGPQAPPNIGAALPVGALDGSEFDLTVAGEDLVWALRLVSGLWRFKGGAPMLRQVAGAIALTSGLVIDTAFNMTVPATGTYDVWANANAYNSTLTDSSFNLSITRNGAQITVGDVGPGRGYGAQAVEPLRIALTKNDVISLGYSGSQAGFARRRTLKLWPVSLS